MIHKYIYALIILKLTQACHRDIQTLIRCGAPACAEWRIKIKEESDLETRFSSLGRASHFLTRLSCKKSGLYHFKGWQVPMGRKCEDRNGQGRPVSSIYLLLNSFNRCWESQWISVVALLLSLVEFVWDVQTDLLQAVEFVLQTGAGVLLILKLLLQSRNHWFVCHSCYFRWIHRLIIIALLLSFGKNFDSSFILLLRKELWDTCEFLLIEPIN